MKILSDFARAVGQLGDARFTWVVLRAIGWTLLSLIAVTVGFLWLGSWFLPEALSIPLVGEITFGAGFFSVAALVTLFALSVFLMIPAASLVVGFLVEDIADAVEDRHYAHLPKAERVRFSVLISDSARFLGLMILANLVALILYFFTTIFAPLIFWAVNGLLLGREYFYVVALRRLGPKGAAALRRRHFASIWLAGFLMAIPLSIPLFSLIVPVLGVATFTHMYHRLPKETGGSPI